MYELRMMMIITIMRTVRMRMVSRRMWIVRLMRMGWIRMLRVMSGEHDEGREGEDSEYDEDGVGLMDEVCSPRSPCRISLHSSTH